MKRWLWVIMMSLALFAGHADAAKRFGGGKSIGQQSTNVTQRQAAPAPATPQQGATNAATPGAAAAAATPKKPWGAMLGGLAAGLGLAWLASSLGLGEAMGQFLMFALLALVIMMAVGWFIRSRKAKGAAASASPFAFKVQEPPLSLQRLQTTVRQVSATTLRPVRGSALAQRLKVPTWQVVLRLAAP